MADQGGHEDALFGFDPAAVFGDAAQRARRAEDSGEGRSGVDGVVEQIFEEVAEIAAADSIEAEGVGVAVDGDPVDVVPVFEMIGDGLRAVPADE